MKNLFTLLLAMLLVACASVRAAVEPDTVLVSSATVKITKADLDAELMRIPEADRFEFLLSRGRIAGMLENMLLNRVLAGEAVQNKLDQNPKVKDEIRLQTERLLAKHRGDQILRETGLKDFNSSARELYLTDPKKSTRPAMYKTWQTLISTANRDKAAAKAKAMEVRAKVLRGDDLEALAKEYSDDPTVTDNGGSLALLEARNFETTFADALTRLKLGETSQPVETKYGFHILYLLEMQPEKKFSFEEMKPQLLIEARNTYLKAAYEVHLLRIKEDPSIKLNTVALDALRPILPDKVEANFVQPETIKAPPRKSAAPAK